VGPVGKQIGCGIVNYSSDEIDAIKGMWLILSPAGWGSLPRFFPVGIPHLWENLKKIVNIASLKSNHAF
jgi:hypothetical protein